MKGEAVKSDVIVRKMHYKISSKKKQKASALLDGDFKAELSE